MINIAPKTTYNSSCSLTAEECPLNCPLTDCSKPWLSNFSFNFWIRQRCWKSLYHSSSTNLMKLFMNLSEERLLNLTNVNWFCKNSFAPPPFLQDYYMNFLLSLMFILEMGLRFTPLLPTQIPSCLWGDKSALFQTHL